jgi:exopolysaccharide production protein ExoZ
MDTMYRAADQAQKGVITPIQYLRGIAAMLVVVFHAMSKAWGFEHITSDVTHIPSGVDLFFVISGFIMWVTTAGQPVSPRVFMTRRIIRVVPLYWLTTLLLLTCTLIPGMLGTLRVSTVAVVQSLLFIPYDSITSPGHIWPVLEPGWTLNYEIFFYTLFALSLMLPHRTRFVTLVGVMCVLTLIGTAFGPFVNPIAATYTNAVLLEFAAGAGVGYFWAREHLRPRLSLSLILILVGFWMLALRSSYSHLIGASIIVIGSLSPVICRVKSRLLLELGNASYSIYLTHMFVLDAMGVIWRHAFSRVGHAPALLFIAVGLLACPIAGCLCYALVEHPITVQLQRLTRSRRVGALQGV